MSLAQLDDILARMAVNSLPPNATPQEIRAGFAAAYEAMPAPLGLAYERSVEAGPLGGDMIIPEGSSARQLAIYYHGGGFVLGSSRTHRVIAGNLARASGIKVLAADYRLAPEHPAPAAHDDAYATYLWALEAGYSAQHIALVGDSAGGNLALSVAVRARDAGLPLPAALALMSPALDFAEEGDSYRSVHDDPIITPELVKVFQAAYMGELDRHDARLTPFYGDLAGLPPTLFHVGSRERMRDDSVTAARRLREGGAEVDLTIWEGMIHSWQLHAPMLEEGMASIKAIATFIKARIASDE